MGKVFEASVDLTLPKKLLAVGASGWVAWRYEDPVVWGFWIYATYHVFQTWRLYLVKLAYNRLSAHLAKAVSGKR